MGIAWILKPSDDQNCMLQHAMQHWFSAPGLKDLFANLVFLYPAAIFKAIIYLLLLFIYYCYKRSSVPNHPWKMKNGLTDL
jgi:hypothetical protein